MGKKSWAIPAVSMAVYVIGLIYSITTGNDLSETQVAMLKDLIYAGVIGSGTVGAAVSIGNKLTKQ